MKKRFAWYPVTVTSGKTIWFATYYQHRCLYDTTTGRPPLNSLYFTWTETASERTWRMLKETVVQNRNVWNEPQLTKADQI
jgi:hypothetical protein